MRQTIDQHLQKKRVAASMKSDLHSKRCKVRLNQLKENRTDADKVVR